MKHSRAGVALFLLTMAWAAAVESAPAIQDVSGKFGHGLPVSIAGSGFGSKQVAGPVVWDDASGENILKTWDGAWPSNNPSFDTAYREPMRGVPLPHANVSRYIAGAHGDSAGADAGYNVVFFKNFTVPSYPYYIYVSWYSRVDDAWRFGGDNNFKTFAFSAGDGPYGMPNNWYVNYGPPTFSSATASPQWQYNDDGSSLQDPDAAGRSTWREWTVNPIGRWQKNEMAIKLSKNADGYIKQWENGRLVIDYAGSTDKYPGTMRTVGIGGYARNYGISTNWRYFSDVYLDYTLARVVLANNASLAKATVIENQIPTSWGANEISVNANLGKFEPGETAYLFVVDSAGAANSVGFPVTIGGDRVAPEPPSSVTVN